MTPKKRKYDVGTIPEGLNVREIDIYRLGILEMLLSAIEGEEIERPPGIFMQVFQNEYKYRKARLQQNNYHAKDLEPSVV